MNAYRFEVPLVKPLVLKGQTYTVRNGILLERDGQWAEASPLPGFSTETLDHVVAALRGEQENPPSLKFALHALECPLRFPMNVPWNFLALGNQKQILDQIEKAKAVDCRVVKIKVGRDTVESDIVLIRNIHDRLPVGVRLRLDANQAWSFEEAVRFATGVGDLDWEYIEEPLQDPFRLEQLYRETGCKFALDETLLKVERFWVVDQRLNDWRKREFRWYLVRLSNRGLGLLESSNWLLSFHRILPLVSTRWIGSTMICWCNRQLSLAIGF